MFFIFEELVRKVQEAYFLLFFLGYFMSIGSQPGEFSVVIDDPNLSTKLVVLVIEEVEEEDYFFL